MTMIDSDDLESYLDGKITELERARSALPPGGAPVFSAAAVLDRQARLLAGIRKDLAWLGTGGEPADGDRDCGDQVTDAYADPNVDELDDFVPGTA
jgi:hypothetical protein